MENVASLVAWGAVSEMAAYTGWRLARPVVGRNDVAAALAQPVGMAVVAWPVWALGVAGAPFTPLAVVAVWGAITLLVAARNIGAVEPGDGAPYLLVRMVGLFLFGLYVLLRMKDPQIMGVEKFMDLGFLTTLTRTDILPPYDMWMAGETISYYYFGHLIWATLHKIVGVDTAVGYQFAIAGQFAMTGLGLFAAAVSLTGKRAAGLFAAIAGSLLGNVWTAWQWYAESGHWNWWDGTRLIAGSVTEYPAFTFTLGDLHAHLMALPYTMAALCGIMVWRDTDSWRAVLFTAAALTAALMINTWDFLTYLSVAAAFTVATAPKLPLAARWFVLAIVPPLLALPYFSAIESPVKGIKPVPEELMTGAGVMLILYGPQIAAALYHYGHRLLTPASIGVALGAVAAGFATGSAAVALVAAMAGWGVVVAWNAEERTDTYTAVLFAASFILVTGCELIFVDDLNAGINERFNTVFKFHYAAWMMTAVASAAVVASLARIERTLFRRAAYGAVAATVAVMAVYPIRAVAMKMNADHFTLDGALHLTPGERAMVAYLKQIDGAPVLIEAGDAAYTREARIAVNTGLPTVVGWWNHELTWRGNWPPIDTRVRGVKAFYVDKNRAVLDDYAVAYIVCGHLERQKFGPDACRDMERFGDPVATDGGETLYKVRSAETP